MVVLTTMTVIELATACVAVLGALGVCMSKSRCDTIDTPCLKIHRQVLGVAEIEMPASEEPTPRPPPSLAPPPLPARLETMA